MGKCLNPEKCSKKHGRWLKYQDNYLSDIQNQFDTLVDLMDNGKINVILEKHVLKRSIERSVSQRNLKEVLEFGWVIDHNRNKDNSLTLVLLGYVGKDYRPLHVVVSVINEEKIVVVTVYDPRSHSWKWNNSYDQRVCFCDHEKGME